MITVYLTLERVSSSENPVLLINSTLIQCRSTIMNLLDQIVLLLSVLVRSKVSEEEAAGGDGKSVIVVGGGVAGLNAAAKLSASGFNVTLFEAMDRIGGRTHTNKFPDSGEYVEMGGEWVMGQKGNSLYELAYPLGLLDDTLGQPELSVFHFGLPSGQLLNSTVTEKLLRYLGAVWEDSEGWAKDVQMSPMNQGEWARYVLKRFQKEIGLHPDASFREAAYDWAHRTYITDSAAGNWFQASHGDSGDEFAYVDGVQVVAWKPPYCLASLHQLILTGKATEDGVYELPQWIHLNTEVTAIEYSTSRETVTVVSRDGVSHTADHVVFTPSLGVLKATHGSIFTPPLPPKKQLAIETLGFGSITKIYLKFQKSWWPPTYEGLFVFWDNVDYANTSMQWWRDDVSKEELLVEDSEGIPLWARSIVTFDNIDSGSAPNVFRAWLSGVPSTFLDELDSSYVQKKVMLVLHKFLDANFPAGLITEPTEIFWTKWHSNEFTRGTYSFRTPQSQPMNVSAHDLGEPIVHAHSGKPLVCFAGEATHPRYYATIHGAYDSGTREYQRILNFHANKTSIAF